jgi:phosphate butyryltransferase
MLSSLSSLHEQAKKNIKKRIVIAAAHDENAMEAAFKARQENIIEPILVGDIQKIKDIAQKFNFSLTDIEIINESNVEQCAAVAVKLINDKQADILMKGNLETAILLKAVLNKEYGLRSGDLLSHIALFEVPTYHKIIAVADAAMNIAPDLKDKISIIKNSVNYLRRLGIDKPKVAILAAVETVKDSMNATIDAAIITKMADRGQIKNCIIDGPLALDNAVSKESAQHKGIISNVAGDADILFAPDIEAANILYKTLIFLAGAKCAAVILGATVPIVLTSRSDSDETKLNSIALAAAAN